jgi:hypothetical protein
MANKRFVMRAAILFLGVWIASGGAVRAQSLSLEDDVIQILSSIGAIDTYIGRSLLRLGTPVPGSQSGFLGVYDSNGGHAFEVHSFQKIVELTGDLNIQSPGSSTPSMQFDGSAGNIYLGGDGQDGDMVVSNSNAVQTISFDGDTATVWNAFSGDGFVKGWARIDSNGSVLGCYNCNTDVTKTLRTALGTYYVDFSPIASDISTRPRIAVLDKFGASISGVDTITLTDDDTGDTSRIRVFTGPAADHSFTITVF